MQATPLWARGLLLAAAGATAVVPLAVADGRDSTETKISVRPNVGNRYTQFKLRWRTPVRIGRHDQLQYDLHGPGYVNEPGNKGCHGRVKLTWFPVTNADDDEPPTRPGEIERMTITIFEIRGAEERGWCPGRYRGWVQLRKLKRSRGCPPDTGRDRCWTRAYIGSFQYSVKEKNEVRPPMPVPRDPLLEYTSNGAPSLIPRGVTDELWVSRAGAALVRLYGVDGNPWRIACLDRETLDRVRRVLVQAGRLDQDRLTRPYPRRGAQSLQFGRDGRRMIETLPASWLSPMKDELRRKLFRTVDSVRVEARRSSRSRPCRNLEAS